MNNQEIDRISMDIKVLVPLLSQKLGDLLASERNIYSRSTERDRMSETMSVLDAISAKIRVAESNRVSSDVAGLSSSGLLSKIKELENVIDTFIVKTELWRGKSTIKIMSHLIYQIRLRRVMDELTTIAKPDFPPEVNAGSAAAADPQTQLTHSRNVDSQVLDDSDLVGLEDKIDELLEKLFHAKDQESDNVIAVTGNAGSGKTILMKKIYNEPYVKHGFNHRAWVGVSEDVEAQEILLNILIELGWKKKNEILSDNHLEMMLKSFLKEKRCLIVVDDVRTPYDLDKLSVVLKCIAGWSRLILTTRNIDIAHAANPWRNPIMLRSLTNEENWKLFLKTAQIVENSSNSSVLINLKEDILKKCGGSPLAITVLGGLLSTKELNGWSYVVEQLRTMDLRVSSTEIKPEDQQLSTTSVTEPTDQEKIITFSYQNLPSQIKVCVLYFGLFPRASEIRVRRLFHLWFAEGLVIPLPKEENMAPEALVESYLKLLIKRKLIKKEKVRFDGNPKTCRMPGGVWDVFHKMAEDLRRFYDITTAYKSAESSYDKRKKKSAESPNIRQLVKYANTENHSCFDPYNKNYSSVVHHIQNLRSYVSFDTQKRDLPTKEIELFINAVVTTRGFGLLIVLDLENVYKPTLPETLGKLLHLKYLGLRWTFLDSLPKSVGNLPYLETLDVKHTNIISLPSSILKAKSLQHLYLNEIHFDMLVKKPNSESLTNLKILWGLSIGDESPVTNCLSKSTGLRKLKLTCTSNSAPSIANWISQLSNLQSLKLRSVDEFGRPSTLSGVETMVVHNELRDLYLLGKLPKAIVEHLFPQNLKILTLSASRIQEDPMPFLGCLQELNILRLLRDSYLGKQMTCLREGFPKLCVLKLWMLDGLENWIVEVGAMPCLRELEIRRCNRLKRPEGLKQITTLKEVILTNMPQQFVADVKGDMDKANVEDVHMLLSGNVSLLFLVLCYSLWQF